MIGKEESSPLFLPLEGIKMQEGNPEIDRFIFNPSWKGYYYIV